MSDLSHAELVDGHVLIRDLAVDGAIAQLAHLAVAEGRDLEVVIRQALEVGAAVLLHGGAKATVDAVAAEADRVLAALESQTRTLEIVRRARGQIASRGLSFEEDLGAVLESCFAPFQDVLEPTGTVKGIADAKVGDFLLTINPEHTAGRARRVVFEAKDRPMTSAKALAELDAAMLNRGACVGVMVFANAAQAPIATKSLRSFPGNRLMVIWDQESGGDLALEVAAQFARTMAIAAGPDDGKLNRRGFADRFAKLINIIDHADSIARGISSARIGLDATESAYEAMREDALAVLYELQDRVA
jgi:hypothetical protein